jgi:hypothetical protein
VALLAEETGSRQCIDVSLQDVESTHGGRSEFGGRIREDSEIFEMRAGLPVVDKAEQIKWFDVLDVLIPPSRRVEEGMQMARECRHPDAQWLVALLEGIADRDRTAALLEQGEDARALFFAWVFADTAQRSDRGLLARASQLGYAPALVQRARDLGSIGRHSERLVLAVRASIAGDRRGKVFLAALYTRGAGCEKDPQFAIELLGQAAELGSVAAQHEYGRRKYGSGEWERHYWMGLAVAGGYCSERFCVGVARMLPSFEVSKYGRVLHTAAPVIAAGLDMEDRTTFGSSNRFDSFLRVVALHRDARSCESGD